MPSAEKKFWDFIQKHLLMISVIAVTILSLYIRYCFRDFITVDMKKFLLEWFAIMQKRGGIHALNEPVGNYNLLYQELIAVMTYIPLNPVYLYKILSVIFDYLMAFAVASLVYTISGDKLLKTLAYIVTITLPIVTLNSSMWGQCDSIFTFFCILSIVLLLKDRYIGCFIAFGFAFAFKLQAVFMLPFYLFMYVYKRRFSILHFLLVPVVMIVSGLPAIFMGQSITSLYTVYVGQSKGVSLAVNYSSFWNIFAKNKFKFKQELDSIPLKNMAIATTVVLLLIVFVYLLYRKARLSPEDITRLALFTSFTCVFFLPKMHERYDYLPIILGIAIAILDRKTLPAFILIVCASLNSYGSYLLKTRKGLWDLFTYFNLCSYLYYASYFLYRLKKNGAIDDQTAQINAAVESPSSSDITAESVNGIREQA